MFVERLGESCSFILSVCPPYAAEEVATEVSKHAYKGLYVDANANSPQRTKLIEKLLVDAGATFVDGSIIGGPAWEPNRTWIYLSGDGASLAAPYFSGGPLETSVIGEQIGKASAKPQETRSNRIPTETAGTVKLSTPHGEMASTAVAAAAVAAATPIAVIRPRGSEGKSSRGTRVATQLTRNIVRDPSNERVLPAMEYFLRPTRLPTIAAIASPHVIGIRLATNKCGWSHRNHTISTNESGK